MKKLHILLFLVTIISCQNELKKHQNLSQNKEDKFLFTKDEKEEEDTIIKNISRVCNELEQKNINEYFLCERWNLLNENQIKDILKSSEKGHNSEGDARTLHYAASEFPIWTTADLIIRKKKYKMKINGGSYFYIMDSENKTSLYFCKSKNCRKYFISGIGPEDDDFYRNQIVNIDKEIKSLKTDLSYWNGNYDFDNGNYEQGYRNYHIKIENNICILYQGQLPAHEIECITVEKNGQLYLYLKSDDLSDAKYDVTLIKSLQKGDFLLKLFKVKDTYFVNSKLINYWNDDKHKFEENVNIEVIKN